MRTHSSSREGAGANTRQLVETYIRAKDRNHPYLMGSAFSATATLEMVVTEGTISFPPITRGLDAISDVLVRRFGQTYENVHTFCLTPAPEVDEIEFSCPWLVGMSEKESHVVRVGVGRYRWLFEVHPPRLVDRLTISIDLMESLRAEHLTSIMRWLAQLPYPWCPAPVARERAPNVEELVPVREYLDRLSA